MMIRTHRIPIFHLFLTVCLFVSLCSLIFFFRHQIPCPRSSCPRVPKYSVVFVLLFPAIFHLHTYSYLIHLSSAVLSSFSPNAHKSRYHSSPSGAHDFAITTTLDYTMPSKSFLLRLKCLVCSVHPRLQMKRIVRWLSAIRLRILLVGLGYDIYPT